MSIVYNYQDSRVLRRFGNLTATSTNEVLVSARTYTQLSSQRQCSVQSTSNSDKDSTASGARQVRITYLDSNYVLKSEDVLTNGTTKVNTVATDIRFIERFEVIKGVAAIGAIQLMDGTGGGANEFCGIAAGTTDAFLCHHYVPTGARAWILNWGTTVDDDAAMKLNKQAYFGGNLVDQIADLQKIAGIAVPPGMLEFKRDLGTPIDAQTYIRVTTAPLQVTSTTIRSFMTIWEET